MQFRFRRSKVDAQFPNHGLSLLLGTMLFQERNQVILPTLAKHYAVHRKRSLELGEPLTFFAQGQGWYVPID